MDDSQSAPVLPLVGCQGLEQFLLLAKTARGPAAVELVKQALEAPGVYVFGELLDTECVKELSGGADGNYVRLLELFAYGTYGDYRSKDWDTAYALWSSLVILLGEAESLPSLTPPQLKKLKHLSIVSLASKCQVSCALFNIALLQPLLLPQTIPYSTLQKELDIQGLRILEVSIIRSC